MTTRIWRMTQDEFREWHARGPYLDYAMDARHNGAPFTVLDAEAAFRWTCPDCGRPHYALIGDAPVSGWDNPRWVLATNEDGKYTAAPSLGCGLMKTEPGHHWWLLDDELVPA
jgi:hypothetical protein